MHVIAGVLLGLAHLSEGLAGLAWVGLFILAVACHRHPSWKLLLLAFVIKEVVALYWLVDSITYCVGFSPPQALLAASAIWGLAAVVTTGPAWVVQKALCGRGVVWWLPVGLMTGEYLWAELTGFTAVDLLQSQWAIQPVLRCLGTFGWWITTFFFLAIPVRLGESLACRSPWTGAPALALIGLLLTLPSLPRDDAALRGLGTVHMAQSTAFPQEIPAGVNLLVWPESTLRRRPRMNEGLGEVDVVFDELTSGSHSHLLNINARSDRGYLNAVVIADPEGRASWVRGKAEPVPLAEGKWLMFQLYEDPVVPGEFPPFLEVRGHKIIATICYEAFSRDVMSQGRALGGEVIALLAADHVFAGHEVGLQQSIGALVMRSVEYGVPAVRSSLRGRAVIIASDGTILRTSDMATTGVLGFEP